jgi:SPP1 gp7 family putative phage head morphogenesis protein
MPKSNKTAPGPVVIKNKTKTLPIVPIKNITKTESFQTKYEKMLDNIEIDADDVPDDLNWDDVEEELKPKFASKNMLLWTTLFVPFILPAFVNGITGNVPAIETTAGKVTQPTVKELPVPEPKKVVSYAQEYFTEHGLSLCQTLTETDLSRLKDQMLANWGIGEEAFKKTFEDSYVNSEARLESIYRSEYVKAQSEGIIRRAQDADHVYKQSHCALDERSCDVCATLDGVVVGIDEDFPGVETDSPPYHVNCRCVLSTLSQEEYDSMSEEEISTNAAYLDEVTNYIKTNSNDCHDEKGLFCTGSSNTSLKESYSHIKDDKSFNKVQEHKIINSVIATNKELWSSKSKDVMYLKKRDGITEKTIPDKLSLHVIYDDTPEYYGRGLASTDNASAKVWWNPYTQQDRFAKIPDYVQADPDTDPITVLSHELHHSFGHENELDLMSRTGAYLSHLDLDMQYAGDGIKTSMIKDITSLYRDDDKNEQRDAAATFRVLINKGEDTLKSWMVDNNIVNNDSFSSMRFSDIKEKAESIKVPRSVKPRDMSSETDLMWKTAAAYLDEAATYLKLNWNCKEEEKTGTGPGSYLANAATYLKLQSACHVPAGSPDGGQWTACDNVGESESNISDHKISIIVGSEKARPAAVKTKEHYDILPKALKANCKELVLSNKPCSKDAELSKKYGHKFVTEAQADLEHNRIISYADENGNERPLSLGTLAHELAHTIDNGLSDKLAWKRYAEKDGHFVSKYAAEHFKLTGKYDEDFAESVRLYITDKNNFMKSSPLRADYIKRKVLGE